MTTTPTAVSTPPATAASGAGSRAEAFAVKTMRVRQVRWEADGVISIELTMADGSPAPAWEPGAHIDVVLPSGLVRQYSLCGDPDDRSCLKVAVLREDRGRGGSRELHETQLVGKTLDIRGPRNHFRLRDADEYLLIAGGIGITPILTMLRHLDADGAAYKLVYGGRSRRTMAFLDELSDHGGVEVIAEDESGLPDLDAILDATSPGTEVWCCGPEGLLRAVEAAGRARGIPVHVERFGTQGPPKSRPVLGLAPTADSVEAAPAGDGAATGAAGDAEAADGAFQVELRQSGLTVDVDPDRSILEVVREHLPAVMSSCEEGFCGACETVVLEGVPDHRDDVLSDDERAANETMMICVSRACSKRLVLDL